MRRFLFAFSALVAIAAVSAFALGCAGSEDEGSGGFSVGDDLLINWSPDRVSFGTVPVFGNAEQIVTVSHAGDSGVLKLNSVTLETESEDFTLVPPAVTSLNPGESTEIAIQYHPKDSIADSGTLVIGHNAHNPYPEAVEIPVSTIPQEATLVAIPDPVNFEAVLSGKTAERSLQIFNGGGDDVTIQEANLRSDSSKDFEVTGPLDEEGNSVALPKVLSPADSIYFRVTYTPAGGGNDQGTLVVRSDHKTRPLLEVEIRGSELGPEIVVVPGTIDLGFVDIGGHAETEVRILNQGTEILQITGIKATLGSNEKLGVADLPAELPFDIEAQGERVFKVVFDPDKSFGAGVQNVGGIAIDSSDADEGTVTVPVYAKEKAPMMVVTPPDEVDFAFTAHNHTTERVVTLFNGGAAALKVSNMTIANNQAGEFKIVNVDGDPNFNFPFEVESSKAREVAVSYTNDTGPVGIANATMNIESNDGKNPTYPLKLTARRAATAECKVAISPGVVQYGIVAHGMSKTMQVKLTNVGSGDCQIPAFDDPDRLRIDDCSAGLPGFPIPMGGCARGVSTIAQSSKRFKAIGSPPPMLLKPGQFATMLIRFIPPTKTSIFGEDFENYQALLAMKVFDVNNNNKEVWAPADATDPANSAVTPNLAASSGISDIAVIPQEVEFGVTTVGCASQTMTIKVYNKGRAPMSVSEIMLEEGCSSEFEVVSTPGLPDDLVQGSPMTIEVRYIPQDTNKDECAVVIVSNDQDMPSLTVPMRGEGTYETEQTDTYTQLSGENVDVLLVVDNSGSMSDEQTNLSSNIDDLVSAAATWNTQYRLAVTTTDIDNDRGKFRGNPRWVTPDTPNGLQTFANDVKGVGDNGGATEQGLEAAYLALTLPNTFLAETTDSNGQAVPIACQNNSGCDPATGCYMDPANTSQGYCGGPNWGFLRDDASLEVVIISDEPDQSSAELTFYIDFLKNLKGFHNEDLMHVHAIVGTDGSKAKSCESSYGGAAAGEGYDYVANETGGVLASICEQDYSGLLQDIGKVAFGLKRQFFLTRQAQANTIEVKVRGSVCTDGWSYDLPSNSIVFDETHACMPQPGDQIEIHYETLCIPVN